METDDLLKKSVEVQEAAKRAKKPLMKKDFEPERDSLLDELDESMKCLQNVLLDHRGEHLSPELKARLEKALTSVNLEVGTDLD